VADAPGDERNALVWFLTELRDFVGLLANLLGDDDVARDMFGFSIDLGLITRVELIEEMVAEAALGRPDLVDVAELGGRLAEETEAVALLKQAIEANPRPGVVAQEVIGQFLDTAGLAYVASRWPFWFYLARLLNLLTENLPQEATAEVIEGVGAGFWRILRWDDVCGLLKDGWRARGGDLQTEGDARQLSALLAGIGLAFAYIKPIVDCLAKRDIDPRTAQVLFGWDPDPASSTPVADDISRRLVTIMLRLIDEDDSAGPQDTYELTTTMAWVPAEHGGPGLWLSMGGGAELDLPLGEGWHLVIGGDLHNGLEMMIPFSSVPAGAGFFRLGNAAGGSIEIRLERRAEGTAGGPADPWRVGSWLEAGSVELALRLSDQDPMLAAVMRVRDAALSLQRPASGLWHYLVPDGGLRLAFDVGLIADTSPRFALEGGSGLTLLIPIRSDTAYVQGLHLFLALRKGEHDDDPFAFEASAGFSLKLGPFTAVVDRFGVVLPRARHALEGAPWFRFPDAIGLGLEAEIVRGGGFLRFDPENGRYAGVLTLTVARYTVTAFGLITDRDPGYSLLVVLSATFKPALTGPFGLQLAGIGGVIGHNHGTNVQALQAAVRTGAVRTMLFPADPVAAAPRVLTTLSNVFPVTDGSSLLGIGLDIGWLHGRVSLVAAVIVESGQASRVLVLGSLLATAPDRDNAVIRVQIDVAGVIDSQRPSVAFDGSLVDSRIGPYTLTGDGTFRFRAARETGPGEEPDEEDEAIFLLAIGGFHPAFTPPSSAAIPPQRRITLALPMENPRLRMELYAAVTSNSVQLGAKLEISARKAGFTAEALIGFDALVTLSPFHLTVDIQARAAIKHDGTTLAHVGLDLTVDGPSPWHVTGKATLSLLFLSITIPIDRTFGSDSPQPDPPRLDAATALRAALADAAAWETTAPSGSAAMVALRSTVATDDLAAHPAGLLGARQEILPLGIDVTHVGQARVTPGRFTVESVTVNDQVVAKHDVRSQFAPGEYLDLSDDEKLSRPAFERFVAGFTCGSDAPVAGPALAADLRYEEIVLGRDGAVQERPTLRRPPLIRALRHGATLGPAATSRLRQDDTTRDLRRTPGIRLQVVGRVVAAADTLVPLAGVPAAQTDTEARQIIATLPRDPAAAALVVLAHEAEVT
jgi:hypothetical protein